jgi:hypothetical protein
MERSCTTREASKILNAIGLIDDRILIKEGLFEYDVKAFVFYQMII